VSEQPAGSIPPELKWAELPDILEEIERGRPPVQQSLLPIADSREARVARIVANVPGVTTASRMTKKGT
jgi:hypothetical protein